MVSGFIMSFDNSLLSEILSYFIQNHDKSSDDGILLNCLNISALATFISFFVATELSETISGISHFEHCAIILKSSTRSIVRGLLQSSVSHSKERHK